MRAWTHTSDFAQTAARTWRRSGAFARRLMRSRRSITCRLPRSNDCKPVSMLRLTWSTAVKLPQQQPAQRVVWRGWMAASIAVMAVAVALLAADRWAQIEARRAQPNYRTVTTSAPRPQGEVIRAVFSPSITLVELQTMLDEAQLRIVSGPTEAGVYSLASNSTLPVRASLALLRQHSSVRFAEGTLPEPESGNSP